MSEFSFEGVQPDILDRDALHTIGTKLSSAFCLPHVVPIGGFVASAKEAIFFHEGFHQNRAVVVAMLPVVWDPLGCLGEDFRCEIFLIESTAGSGSGHC